MGITLRMERRCVRLADGRYFIFYTFLKTDV
jgi:hypothetical protein